MSLVQVLLGGTALPSQHSVVSSAWWGAQKPFRE